MLDFPCTVVPDIGKMEMCILSVHSLSLKVSYYCKLST